jgi:hypothetical protein
MILHDSKYPCLIAQLDLPFFTAPIAEKTVTRLIRPAWASVFALAIEEGPSWVEASSQGHTTYWVPKVGTPRMEATAVTARASGFKQCRKTVAPQPLIQVYLAPKLLAEGSCTMSRPAPVLPRVRFQCPYLSLNQSTTPSCA